MLSVLVIAALAVTVGILTAYAILQDSTIRAQRKANDTLERAVSRERAAREILHVELVQLSTVARIRNLWVAGHPSEVEAWLS